MINWFRARWVIACYSFALIFAGVTCLFLSQRYWKEVVKFNKEWHNELRSV